MKKFILSTLTIFTALFSQGQSCASYYYMTDNAKITMTVYDKNGKPDGKMVYTVTNVTNSGNNASSTINMQFSMANGKSIFTSTGNYKCVAGELMANMHMAPGAGMSPNMKNMQFKVDQSYLDYPPSMHVGDKLKDGVFHMTTTMSGHPFMVMDININNRKVVGKETLTTPAGSWKCYKITYNIVTDSKTMGMGVPNTTTSTEWYAPGFGIIKSQSPSGSMELTAFSH